MSRNNAGLSTDRIIIEALRIIDGQGLRRLTMRRLGDALEVEAMAVYHHFPLGKEQLFDAIAAYIIDLDRPDPEEEAAAERDGEGDPEEPEERAEEPEDIPWDERLRVWAHRYRSALLRHAGALQLLINRQPDTVPALRSTELLYGAFAEAGLDGGAVVSAAAAFESYVTGAVVREVRSRGLESPSPAALDGRFPTVTALRDVPVDHARQFGEGVEALIAALVPVRA
ncbi:TetR/AcrR family transcriptional regulator [Nocardiopsis potens]|uniref:TetR/AcrR family transcriptional regulator n=1 Tax=Nocardiopsis potens TaxID=1246458 RepID=UPI00034D9A3B|nr:TetR/AcrR family transcriptional regulator [Nocardiopsis potens]